MACIYAVACGLLLILHDVVSTFEPAYFGRDYTAYGGFFVVISLLWSWKTDGIAPNGCDVVGEAIEIIGVFVIMNSREIP